MATSTAAKPVADSAVPETRVKVPLNRELFVVTVSDPPEIVNALEHWMLLTVMLPEEMTTFVPAPSVMMTSLVGPGTTPPLQLAATFQDAPSPPPVQYPADNDPVSTATALVTDPKLFVMITR